VLCCTAHGLRYIFIIILGTKRFSNQCVFVQQQAEQDKATKDHQIRNLNDEIAHQDELINKLNKEKKQQGETNQKTSEELQVKPHK
jgi:myosin heavy chain 6/7